MESVDYRALAALRGTLERHARGRYVVGTRPEQQAITLTYGRAESTLLPLWAGEGFPKDIEVATRSERWLRQRTVEGTPVLVARRMSSGAAERLDADRISWADETGRASIHAEPGLLVVLDVDEGRSGGSESTFRWAEANAAVATSVLQTQIEGRRSTSTALPSAVEIAARVGVSTAAASRAMQWFDTQGWTEKRGTERGPGATRYATDPTAMLSSWAAWHQDRQPQEIRGHAIYADPSEYVRDRIAQRWPIKTWALTNWLALERRAPFMTSSPSISLYLTKELFDDASLVDTLLQAADIRRVDRGARIEIRRADPYVLNLADLAMPFPAVSPVRLYGDLLSQGVRGADAANHLRETVIGF